MTLKVLGLVLLLVVCGGGVAAAKDDLKDKCGKESTKVMDCLTYAIGTADAPSKQCCDSVSSIKETDPVCLCYVIQQVHKGDSSVTGLGIKEDRLLKLPSACKLANASTTNCPSGLVREFVLLWLSFSVSQKTLAVSPPTGLPEHRLSGSARQGGSEGYRRSPDFYNVFLIAELLNLPAGSPDAAIFTNATTSHATSTTPGASPGGSSTAQPTTAGGDSGDGFTHAPQLAGVPLLAAAVVAVVLWAFPSVV
nr:non-specific lipid transfer protein GPI-anchored 1 [Ipomoea batatas]